MGCSDGDNPRTTLQLLCMRWVGGSCRRVKVGGAGMMRDVVHVRYSALQTTWIPNQPCSPDCMKVPPSILLDLNR